MLNKNSKEVIDFHLVPLHRPNANVQKSKNKSQDVVTYNRATCLFVPLDPLGTLNMLE